MTSRRSATSGLRLPVLQCLGAAALFGASTPACKALLGEAVMLQCLFAPGAPTSLDASQGLRLKLGR